MANFKQDMLLENGVKALQGLEEQRRIQNALVCLKELKDQRGISDDSYINAIWNLLDDTGYNDVFKMRRV